MYIYIYERDYVEIMTYNNYDPYQFLLNDDLLYEQFKKGFNFYYTHYVLLLNHEVRFFTWAKWENVNIFYEVAHVPIKFYINYGLVNK